MESKKQNRNNRNNIEYSSVHSINIIPNENEIVNTNESENNNKKTAVNNQWVSTGLKPFEDKRERRDGPGGENGK